MELFRKIRGLLTKPKSKLWWAAVNFGRIPLLVRRRRPGAIVGYVVGGITGWSVYDYYIKYLAQRSEGRIESEIRGNKMELNLRDAGLSRDLFIYGVREERGTELLERELEKVSQSVENGVVLEIGANIGYFALAELRVLEEGASLIAFEPDERNANLLERNLELNGYRDVATIERAVIGPSCGTAEFELTEHSNLNKVRSASTSDPVYDTGRTITVDEWSVDEYLDVHEIEPDSVVAARMDVEGYEVSVIRGMTELLAADGPLVLSMEIHPARLDPEDIHYLEAQLAENGFSIVDALTETITAYPLVRTCSREIKCVDSLPIDGPAYNIILKKFAETQTPSLETDYGNDNTSTKISSTN